MARAPRALAMAALLLTLAVPARADDGQVAVARLKADRERLKGELEGVHGVLSDETFYSRLALSGFAAGDRDHLRSSLPWINYFWGASWARDQLAAANRRCPAEGMVKVEDIAEFPVPRSYFRQHLTRLDQSIHLLETQHVDPTAAEVAPLGNRMPLLTRKLRQVSDLLMRCYLGGWSDRYAPLLLEARDHWRDYDQARADAAAAREVLDHAAFSAAQRAGTRSFAAQGTARKAAADELCRLNRDCLGPMLAAVTTPVFEALEPMSRCERDRRLLLRRLDGLLARLQGERTVPLALLDDILRLLDDLGRGVAPGGSLSVAAGGLRPAILGGLAASQVTMAARLSVTEASKAALFGASLTTAELALLNYGIVGPLVMLYAKGVRDIFVKIAAWPEIDENTEAYQWLVDQVETGATRRVGPLIRSFLARQPDILRRATGQAPPIDGSNAAVAAYMDRHAAKLLLTLGYLEEKHGGFPRHKFDSGGTNRYDVGYYRRALRDDFGRMLTDLKAEVAAIDCGK